MHGMREKRGREREKKEGEIERERDQSSDSKKVTHILLLLNHRISLICCLYCCVMTIIVIIKTSVYARRHDGKFKEKKEKSNQQTTFNQSQFLCQISCVSHRHQSTSIATGHKHKCKAFSIQTKNLLFECDARKFLKRKRHQRNRKQQGKISRWFSILCHIRPADTVDTLTRIHTHIHKHTYTQHSTESMNIEIT